MATIKGENTIYLTASDLVSILFSDSKDTDVQVFLGEHGDDSDVPLEDDEIVASFKVSNNKGISTDELLDMLS